MSNAFPKPIGEYVIILDAGSQYGKVIDRKIRELRVDTVILPLDAPTEQLRGDDKLKGIIISGGPSSVHDKDAPAFNPDVFKVGKPVLGICYGLQLLGVTFGGEVKKGLVREDGQDEIEIDSSSKLFQELKQTEAVLLTHGDSLGAVQAPLRVTARSSTGIVAAVEHTSLPLFGVQFHPEVELSLCGVQVFKNFLNLCNCSFDFTMEDREAVALRMIRDRTKNGEKVLCLASGGVDSTVCAVLLLKALGPERVLCVHIDHGFMRKDESAQVVEALQAAGVHLTLVNAVQEFADASTTMPAKKGREAYTTRRLCLATDPEEKRTIIGNTFMQVCDRVIKDMNLDTNNLLLAQGTLRPDLIESGSTYASKTADAIKTHHNDTAVVRQLRDAGKIIEPLCDYHKDEVRELGVRLGIPRHLVERQPFPGPGLAIRTLCSDGTVFHDAQYDETLTLVRQQCSAAGDAAVQAFVTKAKLGSCLLPVRTVGVQGDGRTYAYAAALSMDHFPDASEWPHLMYLAKVIPRVAHAVNRVVFLFGSPVNESPTKVTPTVLVPKVLDDLREADYIVNQILQKHQLVRTLSQVPVILIPVGFEKKSLYSIVVRTFLTSDFMTGVPAVPGTPIMPLGALQEIVESVQALPFVGRVMYDMTAKPPGTTEWE